MSDDVRRKWEHWPLEFRQNAVQRIQAAEKVWTLSRELGVSRSLLYWWLERAGGVRKRPEVDPRERRVRELEKEVAGLQAAIGQKTLELDFFADALRKVRETRQRRSSSGGPASIPKSAGGCKRKAD